MSGSPYIGHFVSIFVKAPALWEHHAMGKAALINFVEPDGLWRNLVMLDGRELYRFGVRGKEFYDAPDKVDAERLFTEVVGKQVPHEFISIRRWIARNVVSDTYRSGRIFFAGDAAHLNHPSSGLGLNTGLGDAVDLGWKLSATLAGWGGGALLDSYEIERQPVGRRNIGHADVSHAGDREREPSPQIFQDTPAGEQARRKMGDAIVGSMTRKFITDGLALGYRYDPSPICWNEAGVEPHASIEDYYPNAHHRQPRAARVARERTVLSSIFSAAASRCCASAMLRLRCRGSSAVLPRAVCRSRSKEFPIQKLPRSMSVAWYWCGPTVTWLGEAIDFRPIFSPSSTASVVPRPSDPPPRRSACRRDRRGGSCRAGISPTA